jgi:hypothetical protein
MENQVQIETIVQYVLYYKGNITYDETQYIKNETFNSFGLSFVAFDWDHGFKHGLVGRRFERIATDYEHGPKLGFEKWLEQYYLPVWQQKTAVAENISVSELIKNVKYTYVLDERQIKSASGNSLLLEISCLLVLCSYIFLPEI